MCSIRRHTGETILHSAPQRSCREPAQKKHRRHRSPVFISITNEGYDIPRSAESDQIGKKPMSSEEDP